MRGMRMRHMHRFGDDHRNHGPGHGRRRARRGSIRVSILRLLRRAADARLRVDPGVRAAHRRALAPEPGFGLPEARAARGRRARDASDVEGRKRFELTDAGRTWLDEHQDEEQGLPWEHPGGGRTGELRRLSAEIVGQLRQLLRFGTPAQLERARDILSRTRSELYEVLAAPPTDEPTPRTEA